MAIKKNNASSQIITTKTPPVQKIATEQMLDYMARLEKEVSDFRTTGEKLKEEFFRSAKSRSGYALLQGCAEELMQADARIALADAFLECEMKGLDRPKALYAVFESVERSILKGYNFMGIETENRSDAMSMAASQLFLRELRRKYDDLQMLVSSHKRLTKALAAEHIEANPELFNV